MTKALTFLHLHISAMLIAGTIASFVFCPQANAGVT